MTRWTCALCHQDDVPRWGSRSAICADCAAWNAANDLAWCPTCQRRKPRAAMHDWRCTDCENTHRRGRYARNPAPTRQRVARWQETHPQHKRAKDNAYRARQKTARWKKLIRGAA